VRNALGRARPPPIPRFFDNLDWDHVNRRLEQAEAATHGAGRLAPEPKG